MLSFKRFGTLWMVKSINVRVKIKQLTSWHGHTMFAETEGVQMWPFQWIGLHLKLSTLTLMGPLATSKTLSWFNSFWKSHCCSSNLHNSPAPVSGTSKSQWNPSGTALIHSTGKESHKHVCWELILDWVESVQWWKWWNPFTFDPNCHEVAVAHSPMWTQLTNQKEFWNKWRWKTQLHVEL